MMERLLKDIKKAEENLQTLNNMIERSAMFPDMQLASGDGSWRCLIEKSQFDDIVIKELAKREKHLAKLKSALEAAEKTARGWLNESD